MQIAMNTLIQVWITSKKVSGSFMTVLWCHTYAISKWAEDRKKYMSGPVNNIVQISTIKMAWTKIYFIIRASTVNCRPYTATKKRDIEILIARAVQRVGLMFVFLWYKQKKIYFWFSQESISLKWIFRKKNIDLTQSVLIFLYGKK